MSLCQDCVKGVRHEGTPEGKWEEIGGVKSYVATPTGDYPKNKIILFFTDVYGAAFSNSQLLADDFARNGIKTIVPDILNGDPIAADIVEVSERGTPDLVRWLGNHGPEKTRPVIDKVVAALKTEGVTRFGATGYCFGARYVFDLAFENVIQVAVVSHPSLLSIPDDFEKYAAESKAPLLINSCTTDWQLPMEAQAVADKILGDGKFAPGYKRTFWEGCTHGFAVRGDLSNPKVKAGKEGSFKASVEWFANL